MSVSPPATAAKPASNIIDTLQQRGLLAQLTDRPALEQLLQTPQVVYTGYDPTADSLHIGNLVTLMVLLHLARAGHRIIVLLGDGTAQVGDPSGKTQQRPLLDKAQIETQAAALAEQIKGFLPTERLLVLRNQSWLGELSYLTFLRDIGRHFSVNRMLAAEAYKQRLARGLSFLEFNYQILQAYDFLQLQRTQRCVLQIGGDDQWGNILAGVDLVRRLDNVTVHGLTLPLLTTAQGHKMGKTQQGAVWLSPTKTSPYAFYQYFVDRDDAEVQRLLQTFTFLPLAEIEPVAQLHGAACNAAKHILAFEVCTLVHGLAAAQAALAATEQAFGPRPLPPALLPSSALQRARQPAGELAQPDLAAQLPTVRLARAALSQGIALVDLLVQAELATSRNAARRLIEQGGVHLGETLLVDPQERVHLSDLQPPLQLRVGKKRRVTITLI